MWFKAFVLLRLPISVGCMLGYVTTFRVWSKLGMEVLGTLLIVVAYLFLAVITIMLFRLHKVALWLVWWLLVLEGAGAVLLVSEGEFIVTGRIEPANAVWVLCAIPIAWALPNAFIFYAARGYFAEPERQ